MGSMPLGLAAIGVVEEVAGLQDVALITWTTAGATAIGALSGAVYGLIHNYREQQKLQ